MITKRILGVLMIVGMVVVSTTPIKAQSTKHEALSKASLGGRGVSQIATAPAHVDESLAAMAQETEFPAFQEDGPKKRAIVGSWLETVTVEGEGVRPPFKSLGTFTEDGAYMAVNQGNVTTNPPFVGSPSYGAWIHLKDRTFAWTTLNLVSDLDRNLLGTIKAWGEYTVNESGNRYRGRFQAEAVDPDGNLIFSIEGTNKGERIMVERLR